MKWLRYCHKGHIGFGKLVGDTLQVHQGNLFENPVLTDLILSVSDVQILAPCQPTKILALWNNFKTAAEKNGWGVPSEPLYFLKSPNSYSHHLHDVIRPNPDVGRVVYEAELGIVIGKSGRDISIDQANKYVFGFTCVNDVTAIELIRSDVNFEQWTRAKNFDGFTPFGPWIETDLDFANSFVKAKVNGRERQNYPISDMFFSPHELVSKLSRGMTLEVGDIISCGTSLGAMPWQSDAVVEISIDGIGTLNNTLKDSA